MAEYPNRLNIDRDVTSSTQITNILGWRGAGMLVSRERPQRHGEFEAGVRVRDPPPRDRQGDRRQDGSGHGTGTVKNCFKRNVYIDLTVENRGGGKRDR